MRIAFDHQIFTMQKFGGISRYFIELAKHLTLQNSKVKVFAPFHKNIYLDQVTEFKKSGIFFNSFPKYSGPLVRKINQPIELRQMKSWRPDIIHETYYSINSYNRLKVPRIITVYDMIHELFPESFLQRDKTVKLKNQAIQNVDRIICISENTKKDLLSLYKIPENCISVVYLGVNQPVEIEFTKLSRKPYLLYVGQRSGYKNFLGLIQAFARSSHLQKDFDIVAFGGKPFSKSELSMIAQFGLDLNRVQQVSGNDQLLGSYYHGASAFVFPSSYEGFGLPPLEAMSFGCPVVSSHTSSMPEVVGEAGHYFDPYDFEMMKTAIEEVVYSSSLSDLLIKKGKARVKDFSWEKCARQTYQVYESALE